MKKNCSPDSLVSRSANSSKQLHKKFVDQLKDIYHGEKNLNDAFPKLSMATTKEELKLAYQNHLHETKKQVKRLEEVFELLVKKTQAVQDISLIINGENEAQFEMTSLKTVTGLVNMKVCHGLEG